MKSLRRKILKTPISYYGGKQSMLNEILCRIPEHQLYVEPFFGGGAVFFAKPPSKVEIINDINSEVINFYVCLKNHFNELNLMIQSTLHSRQMYEDAKVIYNNPHLFHRLKRAWAFWVLTNQGRTGIIGSWGHNRQKNVYALKTHNRKEAFDSQITQRISLAQIECGDALELIKRSDSEDTFFYLDPPYINCNQGHYRGYSEVNFKDLLDQLVNLKGKFLLSCYPNKLISHYSKTKQWYVRSLEKHSPATGGKKVELLTANYAI